MHPGSLPSAGSARTISIFADWPTSALESKLQGSMPARAGPRVAFDELEISSSPTSCIPCFTRCATYQIPATPMAPKIKITTRKIRRTLTRVLPDLAGGAAVACDAGEGTDGVG